MIYLYNKTKYNDNVLKSVLETAYKQVSIRGKKLKGDVAVKILYSANSCGYVGQMDMGLPRLTSIVGSVKKYGKGYRTKRSGLHGSFDFISATPDGSPGWIIIRLPKYSGAAYGQMSPATIYETILHELIHIWQYRNKEDALSDWGRPGVTWSMFWDGYSSPNSHIKLPYSRKPLEVHVREKVAEVPNTSDRVMAEFALTKELKPEDYNVDPSKTKNVSRPKYNKFGERISDYRNVKMKTLRNGDKVVPCPHCGEKSIVLSVHSPNEYTHVAAVDREMIKYGWSASEARYTQFGHGINEDGSVVELKIGE